MAANWQIPWDRSPVPPTVLRTDPDMLVAQDVDASGGSGLLAFADEAVRRKKALEEAEKAAKEAEKLRKEQEEMADETNRGRGRAPDRGRGPARGRGRGARGDEPYGQGVFDPEHPKRRPVVGMVQPRGVPLEGYEEIRVAYWATVVAKVPVKEQVQRYRDAFENAKNYDPMADLPQYLGYFVERAEVRPGNEEDLKWERVSVYDGKSSRAIAPGVAQKVLYGATEDMTVPNATIAPFVTQNWAGEMPEVVDPRYLVASSLVFPLPPLVGRDWGSEVTHPDIPLASEAVETEEGKSNTPAPAQPAAPEDAQPGSIFAGPSTGGAGAGRPGGFRGMEGGLRPRGGGYRPGPAMGGMRGMGGGGFMGRGGGFGEEEGFGRGAMRGGYAGRGGMGVSASGSGFGPDGMPEVPYWLLRFFDFSVEPGKKYKYRVQLAVLDPNQSYNAREVPTASLDGKVLDRIRPMKQQRAGAASKVPPLRFTEWSQPTPTVSIPFAGGVSVASAKPASDKSFNTEPRATLLVQSFGIGEKGNAIQAAEEEDFQRGAVANMVKDSEVLVDQNRAIDPIDDFRFKTGITVADIRGGEQLTRKENRPASVLLMGPTGQLFVQDEVSDADVVETHRALFAKEPPGGMPGFGPMRGYGPGRGRGGMGMFEE